MTPLGAIVRGALAGAAGLLAMDSLWYRRYKQGGGGQSFAEWESSAGVESYDQAGPPAQVGRRVVGGFLGRDLEPGTARAMNNAVHWLTGVGWGVAHGVVVGSFPRQRAVDGIATGVVAWGSSYLLLGAAGVYKPIWEYPREVLWQDFTAHLLFGATMGVSFRLSTADRRSSLPA
jgi:hypothetical protein